ncbi:MAG TPA: COQ9 family protein [Phenylobacterium sp.]|jgi:ubiquinone biosynthesis protein COQ9
MTETNDTARGDWATRAEQKVLDAALALAPSEGWTRGMVTRAAAACGFSAGETELLLPHGPADLAALLSRRHDAQALAALADVDPATLKVRERIARGLAARLDAAVADGEAERRLAGFLALPPNLPLAARLAWESADVLWRWAGDTATDENHYSKRFLLANILAKSLAIDLTSGREAALAFVDRKIEQVMAFEKWKATTRVRPSLWLAQAAHRMGERRYGRRPAP